MMQGMGAMMQNMPGMGASGVKPVYPALMELPDLPLERRAQVQARAHERMREATQLMNEAQRFTACPQTGRAPRTRAEHHRVFRSAESAAPFQRR
jgi:hypothetical protein